MKRIIILISIFFFTLTLRLVTINDIGRTWDEPLYVNQGYKMLQLTKAGDLNNSFFYTTYDHPPFVKYIYGLAAQFDVSHFASNGEAVLHYDLTYSRILSAIIFSLGVVIVVLIGWNLFSAFIGVVAGLVLALLPFTLGLSQLVTTESFKIFIYPLVFYSFVILLKKYSLKHLLLSGIMLGFALQVKQSNGLLLPLFVAMSITYYLFLKKKKERVLFFKRTIKSFLLLILISSIVFMLLWPQMLFHLSDIYEIHRGLWHVQFTPKIWLITMSVPEVFFGKLMITPNFYYFLHFFISIPVVILFLFFAGVRKIYIQKNWVHYSLILWFLIPFGLSLYSWRQHGLRYLIEIYPAIALISAIGFDYLVTKITKNTFHKFLFFLPVIMYLCFILWQTKPYYLDYYNEVIGGTNTVYRHRLFQQGWWGEGLGEAGKYLIENAPAKSHIGLAISPTHVFPKDPSLYYEKWSSKKSYDYVVVNYYNIIREGFNDEQIKSEYKLIKEIKVDNATLVFVYKKKK